MLCKDVDLYNPDSPNCCKNLVTTGLPERLLKAQMRKTAGGTCMSRCIIRESERIVDSMNAYDKRPLNIRNCLHLLFCDRLVHFLTCRDDVRLRKYTLEKELPL